MRSEAEVGADLLYTLLDARLLHPDQLNRALLLTGLTLQDIADAKLRSENGRARPARRAPAWPNVGSEGDEWTAGADVSGVTFNEQRPPSATVSLATPWTRRPPDPGRDQTRRARNPVPKPKPHDGERFCSTCGLWLAETDFADGKATCRPCLNSRRRQRYLDVKRAETVQRAALRWYRQKGDPALRCGVCHKVVDVDEECVMVGEVRHADCLGTAPVSSPGEPGRIRSSVGKSESTHDRGRLNGTN